MATSAWMAARSNGRPEDRVGSYKKSKSEAWRTRSGMLSTLYSIREPKSSRPHSTSPGHRPRIDSMHFGAVISEGNLVMWLRQGTPWLRFCVDSEHIPMICKASSWFLHDSNIYLYRVSSRAKEDSPDRGFSFRMMSRRCIGSCRGDEMYLIDELPRRLLHKISFNLRQWPILRDVFSSKCDPVRNDRVWHYTHTCGCMKTRRE